MPDTGTLSEDELIAQAKESFTGRTEYDLLQACEEFYMNGSADEFDGDADTFGHFYRVHRWIVWTDSQGFHEVETHDTEAEAKEAYVAHSRGYHDHYGEDRA
jgi:hypothetical protein